MYSLTVDMSLPTAKERAGGAELVTLNIEYDETSRRAAGSIDRLLEDDIDRSRNQLLLEQVLGCVLHCDQLTQLLRGHLRERFITCAFHVVAIIDVLLLQQRFHYKASTGVLA